MAASGTQETADVDGGADDEWAALSEDEAYHLLQNERRRNVLRYLEDVDGSVEMRDVAEQVAAWENDTTVAALSSDERQRVYIPLYQCHLPKLDEEDVIEYDQGRGIVQRGAFFEELNAYLAPAPETGDPVARGRYYLGASGVGATLLVGSATGVPRSGRSRGCPRAPPSSPCPRRCPWGLDSDSGSP